MILYAVIARSKDGTVLVESTIAGVESTNFPQVTVEVLQRVVATSNWNSALGTIESSAKVELLPDGTKRTFVQRHDEGFLGGLLSGVAVQWGCLNGDAEAWNNREDCLDYYFHMCRGHGIICLCISDDTDARYHAVNFNFLDDAQSKFTSAYSPSKIAKAKAYEMDKQFSRELGKLIHYYNENRNKFARHDKVDILLDKVDDLREVLGRNISMILERERRLDDLIEQSENMMMDTKVRWLIERLKTLTRRTYQIILFCTDGI